MNCGIARSFPSPHGPTVHSWKWAPAFKTRADFTKSPTRLQPDSASHRDVRVLQRLQAPRDGDLRDDLLGDQQLLLHRAVCVKAHHRHHRDGQPHERDGRHPRPRRRLHGVVQVRLDGRRRPSVCDVRGRARQRPSHRRDLHVGVHRLHPGEHQPRRPPRNQGVLGSRRTARAVLVLHPVVLRLDLDDRDAVAHGAHVARPQGRRREREGRRPAGGARRRRIEQREWDDDRGRSVCVQNVAAVSGRLERVPKTVFTTARSTRGTRRGRRRRRRRGRRPRR